MNRLPLSVMALAAAVMSFGSCGAGSVTGDSPWDEADRIVSSMSRVSFPDREVSIEEFGARVGDSLRLSTEAINLAILSVSQEGGGTVVVPSGTFYTGPITLKSNVRLHLEDGATLRFSTDPEDYLPVVRTRWEGVDCYNAHPLIYAYGETNIAITGKGTIDGGGTPGNWWGRVRSIERAGVASRLRLLRMGEERVPVNERVFSTPEDCLRPQTINFLFCTTVLIEDVTLLRSPFWVIHPVFCNDLTVRGVTINNNGPNGDGCDPESCRNVLIEDCTFNTGDDCIAIKSGRNEDGRKWSEPTENVVVRGCTMANGHGGIVIGSEISGGFRGLYMENCRMDSPNLDRVVRIKTSTARGGIIEDVFVRNIEVGRCREAVLRINLRYEPGEDAARGFIPTVRNVRLENITCRESRYGIRLDGLEESEEIYGIHLKDCDFTGVGTGGNLTDGRIGEVTMEGCTLNGAPMTL